MPYCWRCKTPYAELTKVPTFHATCDRCKSYWHSCCNCRHFSGYPLARCRLPNIEAVHDVEGANFCDEFQLADQPPGSGQEDKGTDARRKWDDLFKS